MNHIVKFENFQSDIEVDSCVQNLLDIGFDYWESERIVTIEGLTTVDNEFIVELESTIKKLSSIGHNISVIKWNGETLKIGEEPGNTIYIHYPDLTGKNSEKGEPLSALLDFFKSAISSKTVKIKFMALRITQV